MNGSSTLVPTVPSFKFFSEPFRSWSLLEERDISEGIEASKEINLFDGDSSELLDGVIAPSGLIWTSRLLIFRAGYVWKLSSERKSTPYPLLIVFEEIHRARICRTPQ
jgi:hypothetical protein